MKYYIVEPEVSGEFGEKTVEIGKKTDRPPQITKLHYEFNYWPEDDFLTYLCMFIGSDRFRKALETLSPPVTGVKFDHVEISGSPQEFERVWRKGRPDSDFGVWHWFKITGRPFVDDFAYIDETELLVSERVLAVLKTMNMKYCNVTERDPVNKSAETSLT
ncbi:MAG TPA: hypothetical protein V6D08_03840 [Candidatus Obscuribacterales bacterium]